MRGFAAPLALVCLGYAVLASGALLLQQQPTAVIQPVSQLDAGSTSTINATSQQIIPISIPAPPVTAPVAAAPAAAGLGLDASTARPLGAAPAATRPVYNASAVVPVTVLPSATVPAAVPAATTPPLTTSTPGVAPPGGLTAAIASAGSTATSQAAATAAAAMPAQSKSGIPGASTTAGSAGVAAVYGILHDPTVNQRNPATLSERGAAAHAASFKNLLGPDAMTVGNHEWDKGLPALKRYIDAMHNKAVLGANIDFQGHELKDKIKPYVVKQVKGKKICIFGLTTMYGLPGKDQMWPVKIKEPYSVGREVLNQLDKEGCHTKVLLSHLGYTSDLAAVRALPGVDLIIGGHSHSFLWPDPAEPPAFYKSDGQDSCCKKYEHDEPWGAYPTNVYGHGKDVPVFQASWGSRYMRKIVLTFEPESAGGKLSGITSDIALLGGPKSDQHIAQDEEALQLIDEWRSW